MGGYNALYDELFKKQIIPEIKREDEEQLSIEELSLIAEKVEKVVEDYTQEIENSDNSNERKVLRSERKTPK